MKAALITVLLLMVSIVRLVTVAAYDAEKRFVAKFVQELVPGGCNDYEEDETVWDSEIS